MTGNGEFGMAAHIGATARGLGIGIASVVLGGALTACGSGALSDQLAPGAQKWADFKTVLADKDTVKRALPDSAALPGWKGHRPDVSTADGTDEECRGCEIDGTVEFESGSAKAAFKVITFGSATEASAYLATTAGEFEKKADKGATKLSVPAVGNESVAYTAASGGRPRNVVLMRVGTTFSGVMVQDSTDTARLQALATMLARRVEQAAAGQPVDAALDTR
ncbi:hypothetical protein [Kitasatospora sp. NPDC096140]|uniref:hypothetical protein n=1 Tax=unclassified Kitasatospora TaxID=2633591 RepID=UPI003324AFA1